MLGRRYYLLITVVRLCLKLDAQQVEVEGKVRVTRWDDGDAALAWGWQGLFTSGH